MSNDLLIEIGTEELPPKAGLNTLEVMADRLERAFKDSGFDYQDFKTYHAPRRLAFYVVGMVAQQPDQMVHRQGPFLDKAYDENKLATPALIGFAKSCGVSVDDLLQEETPKGPRVAFRQMKKGQHLSDVLPQILHKACHNLPIPRLMRWGNNTTSFIRPVHSLVVLYGQEVIGCELFGCVSDRVVMGHPVMHPAPVALPSADQYVDSMKKAFVLVDATERQQVIEDQLQRLSQQHDYQVVMSQDLLAEVNQLVSWPCALECAFDTDFLKVPEEALIKAMESHQKCFAIRDHKGQLSAKFITIANLDSQSPDQVILGNQRVMKARLSDAQFFYEKDAKVALSTWQQALNEITFEKRLGSVGDKVKRLTQLSLYMAKMLHLDVKVIERVASLCKVDLVSDMVGEFPSLQGTMGRYYAKLSGESDEVAEGIEAHYWPRFSGDRVPKDPCAAVVGIADRIDSLVGIFSVGMAPTGDKDPYGLRRSALALARLLIELKLPLDLRLLFTESLALYQQDNAMVNDLLSFVLDRLKAWYASDGVSSHIFEAVRAANVSSLLDFHRRIEAVKAFSQLPEAHALVSANKRVGKILAKNAVDINLPAIEPKYFQESAEQDLYQALAQKKDHTRALLAQQDYQTYLAALADLKHPIDLFFEQVMVMADDPKVKLNRLALLNQLKCLLGQVADMACLND